MLGPVLDRVIFEARQFFRGMEHWFWGLAPQPPKQLDQKGCHRISVAQSRTLSLPRRSVGPESIVIGPFGILALLIAPGPPFHSVAISPFQRRQPGARLIQ